MSFEYDPEADSGYLSLSPKRADITLEIGERIGVDFSKDKKVVGIEIIDASSLISEILGRAISKENVKKVICKATQSDAIYLDFEYGKHHGRYAIANPYKSPLLSVA